MSTLTKFKIYPFPKLSKTKYFSTTNQNENRESDTGNQESNNNSVFSCNQCHCIKNLTKENNFVSSANANYMEYLFSKWIKDPTSVHESWKIYFSDMGHDNSKKPNNSIKNEFSRGPIDQKIISQGDQLAVKGSIDSKGCPPTDKSDTVQAHIILKLKSDEPQKPVQDAVNTQKQLFGDKKNISCKSNTNIQKPIEQDKKLDIMERIKDALKQKSYKSCREYISAQIDFANKEKTNKSIERKLHK